MNFDEAIKPRSAWKATLSGYLSKPDGSLQPNESDSQCPLGQWIYGEGQKWALEPAFSTLKTEHAAFHKATAGVVRKANSGKPTEEETALGSHSDFGRASTAVVTAIIAIKREYRPLHQSEGGLLNAPRARDTGEHGLHGATGNRVRQPRGFVRLRDRDHAPADCRNGLRL